MSFVSRALFVGIGIIAGAVALDYFVFGNTVHIGLAQARLGSESEAKVRPACFPALVSPKKDRDNPTLPYGQHRIAWQDHDRMVDMTAALHCYLVTQKDAVCDPDNRAYVVDYIERYFQKMDAMLETARRYGDDEVRNVRDLWDSANNRAIMAAIETHIRLGRLKRSDFGWSLPAALKPLFDRSVAGPDYCNPDHPWVAVKM